MISLVDGKQKMKITVQRGVEVTYSDFYLNLNKTPILREGLQCFSWSGWKLLCLLFLSKVSVSELRLHVYLGFMSLQCIFTDNKT